MDVYKIFLASLLGFALLNYFVIPSAKKKWNANKSLAKVSKAGVLGALNFARTFLLIAALTYLALSILIFLQGISVGVTTAELKAAAEKIQKYRDIISSTQKYLVGWIALMLIAILALLSCRREKRHLQEDFAEKIARERERLQREAEQGRWEPLPPTQEMRAILERVQAAQQTYDLLESGQVLVNGDINAHRETLRKAIRELRDAWHALDFERRMQISFDSDPSSSNESQRSGKFGDFISSKGFLASMKTASRSLSHAGTALLVISLVGVSGTSVSNNLEAQQVRWNDLRVEANQKETKEKFDRLLAQNPTETVKKEDDEKTKKENKAVYNYLARNFELSLAQSTVWRNAQQYKPSNATGRRNAVKSEILSESRTSTSDAYKRYWDNGPENPASDGLGPKPGPKPGPKTGPGSNHPSSERNPRAQPPDQAASGRTVVEVPEPETLIGKQVAKDLEATLEKRPNLLARIKAKIVSQIGQFSEPAEITDAADYAFSEIFGTFVDSSVGTASSEVNNLLSKVGKSAIKNSGKEAYQILYQRMMNDLAGETSVADTYGHIRTFTSADFPIVKTATLTPLSDAALSLTSSEEYAKYLEQHPPALADNPLDAKELELAAEKFKTTYDPKRPTVELNAFASYDDIYKAQGTARTQTLKERLVAELRNEAPRAEEITSTSADFSRSRSFAELVGHSDTGGVLIGRAPDDVSQAGDFIDVRWTIDNKLLSLVLTRADGKEFALGPYKTSLVHQALAYAADGRKSSVTILNVDQKGHQKVFLHPAFVDSDLGREIIELDKFIFDVMEKQPTYIAAEQRIEAQRMLYEMAYVDRFAAFNADQLRQINLEIQQGLQISADQSKEIKDVEGRLRKEQSWLADSSVNQLATEAFKAPGDLTDSNRSILARKPEFFDAKIVEKIGTCATNARSSRDFNQCMQSSFDYEVSAATDATLKEWAIPPPKIESLSGVRETPFTVTSDLNFLRIETASGPSQLWPLDYTILRAFSSTPAFLTNGKDPAKYVDLNPWEFDELKPEIAQRVWNKINADANLRLMYQDLRDFTVLQRLFRVALETDAWKQFPIEKLPDLTRATADSHKYVPTQRWENPLHGSLKPDLLASD